MRIFALMLGALRGSEGQIRKGDVPSVEEIRQVCEAVVAGHWSYVRSRALEDLKGRLLDLPEPLEPEEDVLPVAEAQDRDRALEALLLSLVLLVGERLRQPFSPAATEALAEASSGLLEQGGIQVGVAASGPQAFSGAALADLGLAVQGRFDRVRGRIRAEVEAYLTTRSERAALRADPQGAILARLREILEPSKFLPATVDQWAYRWFNVGAFEAAATVGIPVYFAINNPPEGPDEKTTPFCRRIHGRVVDVQRGLSQVDAYVDAVLSGDLEGAKRAWPMLNFKGTETPEQLDAIFLGVGLPPYHFFCRTIAFPSVV